MYITEILNILEKTFPSKSNFNSDKEDIDNYTIKAIQLIQNPLQDIFENLNLSVITGEYISIDVEEDLNNIELFVNTIPDYFSSGQTLKESYNVDNYITKNLIKPILQSIKLYKLLLNIVNRIIDYKPGKILFDAFQSVDKNNIESEYLDLFSKNIWLAEIDHKLPLDNQTLTNLVILRQDFKNQNLYRKHYYSKILNDKCNFLIKKLHNRFELDENNYLYSFDFQDQAISEENIPAGIFKPFGDTMDSHYLNNNPQSIYCINRLKDIDNKYGTDKVTLTDYHFQISRYKDVTSVEKQIDNLIKEFKEKFDKVKRGDKSLFNKRAYDISYNYILNNKLSFLIKSDKSSDKIESTMEEIKALQDNTRVPNYFPYYKYCQYLSKKIDLLFRSSDNNLLKIKENINTLDSYLKLTFKKIDNCKEQNFNAYQLPYEECLISFPIGNNTIQVFLSSSFYLPINYDKVKKSLDVLYNQKNKFNILYETHKVIETEKEEILEIKADLDKKDNRSIEILSIFSAIVLFASGNIQIWKEGMPINDALLFMLTFTYSLAVFVSLLWLITRKGAKVSRLQKVLVITYILFGYLAFAFLIKWFPFN